MKVMFQKLVEMETKIETANAVVEEANAISNQALAIVQPPGLQSAGEQNLATAEDLQDECFTTLPRNASSGPDVEVEAVSAAEAENEVCDNDKEFVKSLRGSRKEDAVLNLLLNRSCRREDVSAVLDDMEKYFQDELPNLSSFLGMKFGFKVGEWTDCRSQILTATGAFEEGSSTVISLGGVLKDMRRSRANNRTTSQERRNHLTDELTRPRRNKRRK